MGKTRDTWRAGGGMFRWVAAVEGYEHLLHSGDHSAAQASAAAAAYSSTDWTQALGGLDVDLTIEEASRPWDVKPTVNICALTVLPDDGDTFGRAVWKDKPDYQARLTADWLATLDGGELEVEHTLGLGSTGTIYVGGEAMDYSAKGASSFTIDAGSNGKFTLLGADQDSGTVPGSHNVPGPNFDTAAPPKVTSSPTTAMWIGRWVWLHLHRVVGGPDGTLDSLDEAELVFAGTIKDVQEDSDGRTRLVLEDLRGKIRDAVLMRQQFKGRVAEGTWVHAGSRFEAESYNSGKLTATPLAVVASGANGPGHATPQIEEGMYTATDLVAVLNEWLKAQQVGSNLHGEWGIALLPTEAGTRTRIEVRFSSTTSALVAALRLPASAAVARLLGWDIYADTENRWVRDSRPELPVGAAFVAQITSTATPLRVTTVHNKAEAFEFLPIIQLDDDTEGTWIQLPQWLPPKLRPIDSADVGIIQIGDDLVVRATRDSATQFSDLKYNTGIGLPPRPRDEVVSAIERTVDEEGDVEVKQIVVLSGAFSDLVTRLLCSIDGNRVNHPTYDEFPFGAGIPYGLMPNLRNSLRSIEQSATSDAMLVVLEKPTSLLEVLMPDMLLRTCWLIWRYSDGLQLLSLPTPNAATADVTLTESDKGIPVGDQDSARTITEVTAKHLRNVLKVKFNRRADGTYRDTITAKDLASIGDHGGERPVTIKARNSYSSQFETGEAVEEMVASVLARMVPVYGKPLRTMRRSLLLTQVFDVHPAATAALSDSFVRDPTTGERQVTSRACVIDSVSWNPSRASGSVGLMRTEEDRTFPYAPSCDVDETENSGSYVNGWDSSAKKLKIKPNVYSESDDGADDETYMADGDLVQVVKVDPADPADADNVFSDSLAAAPSNNELTLTNGFGVGGRPAFDTACLYRVTYDDRATVAAGANASDQVLHAYLAGADGLIQDDIEPNLYGEQTQMSFGDSLPFELPEFHVDALHSEGQPMSSALARQLGTMLSNLVNFKCAPVSPMYWSTNFVFTNTTDFLIGAILLVPVQTTAYPGGRRRHLRLQPRFKAASGTVTVRATVCELLPRDNEGETNPYEDPIFFGEYQQMSWATSSTSFVTGAPKAAYPLSSRRGICLVVIEARGNGTISGLARCDVGPLWRARYARSQTEWRKAIGSSSFDVTTLLHFIQSGGDDSPDLAGSNNFSLSGAVGQGTYDPVADSITLQLEDNDDGMVASGSGVLDVTTGSVSLWWAGVITDDHAGAHSLMGKRADPAGAGYELCFRADDTLSWECEDTGGTEQAETIDFTKYFGHPVVIAARYDVTNDVHRLYLYVDGRVIESSGTTAGLGSLTNAATAAVGNVGGDSSASFNCAEVAWQVGAGGEGWGADQVKKVGDYFFGGA